MINTRSIILITAALIVAGITAFLARSLLSAPEAAKTTIVQQVASEIQVLVAADDVPTGHFLKKEDLTWQSWPGDNINENYTQKKSDAAANSQMDPFIGAVAKTPIAAGEPILNGRVVKPGSRGFMAAVLKPGYRAVSIAINSRTGLSGFIFPGDSVDILLTHDVEEDVPGNEGGKTEIQAAETVLTDIRVLAIDTQMTNETNTPSIGKIATFEVLPKQAEKIAFLAAFIPVGCAVYAEDLVLPALSDEPLFIGFVFLDQRMIGNLPHFGCNAVDLDPAYLKHLARFDPFFIDLIPRPELLHLHFEGPFGYTVHGIASFDPVEKLRVLARFNPFIHSPSDHLVRDRDPDRIAEGIGAFLQLRVIPIKLFQGQTVEFGERKKGLPFFHVVDHIFAAKAVQFDKNGIGRKNIPGAVTRCG